MDYLSIHKKWGERWAKGGANKFDINSKKPKYYCLQMFPYPSGANLHLGHYFNYAVCDTHARFKRMTGFNVFQPFGFDSFGLPAENYAIKTGTHPRTNTMKNIEIMKRQIDDLGHMHDWDYAVNTCDVDYYKWTQWLFVELFNAGLAYQKNALVNWCGKCNTVLANEQVLGGECERCQTSVVRKDMKQWFFKITDFAEELLAGLDGLDWPNKTKVMQRNWIGKSTGSNVKWPLVGAEGAIETYTTRIDTLFGTTFLVVAPEHPIIEKITTSKEKAKVDKYVKEACAKSDIERMEYSKTGVFTGGYALNPGTKEQVPVYVADYVLYTYGTGAVLGVPAHDYRDFDFAKKYGLEIPYVLKEKGKPVGDGTEATCCGHDGLDNFVLVGSGQFDGQTSEQALTTITEWLAKDKLAEFKTTYRLRDWGIGRQRYWGCPIPIIYCDCGVHTAEIPVVLPEVKDFRPKGTAPLASVPEFVNCKCPKCGKPATREVDTMDTFVCSSWYFLRYPDARNEREAFSGVVGIASSQAPRNDVTARMLPVDKYIGGAEHACMHLLYARFITMFLKKRGFINFSEPFTSLVHQGTILGTDGTKMSKSKGNTKDPGEYTNVYGSDILRLFMLFGFNYIEGGPWNDNTLKTVTRFTERIEAAIKNMKSGTLDEELRYVMHSTIKAVRNDLETFSFNTAVARCMELLNAIQKSNVTQGAVVTLVLLTAPMFPHIAEEFWEMLGNESSVFDQPYPVANEKYLVRETIEIAVQINSRIVGRVDIPSKATQQEVEKLCGEFVAGKSVKKVIYISGKLVNFIV